ncbi:hypothetical protein [Allohahella sp. A8]|uniref:hypothetical protein n=1 Tax=Allohahella sp. A8 TaxID=3141461 RepID=UPI00269310FE
MKISPAEQLNRSCLCRTVDQVRLEQALTSEQPDGDLHAGILRVRPHLFSNTAVFVTRAQVERMQAVIAAVEHVVQHPRYRETVTQWAPATAAHASAALGVFMGYDFHMGEQGPQLIEINTNAGGAFLNSALLSAQQACCGATEPVPGTAGLDANLIAMFRTEWARQRGAGLPLTRVAIVDEDPSGQYLYPEFQLAQRLFARHGIDAVIADPSELVLDRDRLLYRSLPVDLVYNRLTDFALLAPQHTVLKAAWLSDAAVFTPHPAAHALYADKRNLAVLSDTDLLSSWGIAGACLDTLQLGVPRTVSVTAANADDLWARRKSLFFKPAGGYGSKAAYRGDKLTRRVWDDIRQAEYVAQDRVAPSERALQVDGQQTALKLDIRAYAYAGELQLLAARLYQGQTTNFRTPGGGFAAVFVAG